jgi:peptidylprolyl isomerase
MFLKSLVAASMCLALAGAAAAQRPQILPTSKAPAPTSTISRGATVVPPLTAENTWNLDLSTGGRVVIQLRPDAAPGHVERVKTLTRQGFYNGLTFHRVIEGFMAQGGDPTGTGTGGSELPDLVAEFNALPHVRGVVSAARTEAPDTANSQFFIMLAPRLSLDGKYSVFGRVVSGMAFVDAIQKGEPPANPSRIVRASLGTDNVPPPSPAEISAAVRNQATSAAADAAASQSLNAAVAAAGAAQAAQTGDSQKAAEGARAAAVAAEGAARAAKDAAEVAEQPKKPAPRKRQRSTRRR